MTSSVAIELPAADAPTDDHRGDEQRRGNGQADLQSQERNNEQTHQWKSTHPDNEGKRHIIKVTRKSSQHDFFFPLDMFLCLVTQAYESARLPSWHSRVK